MSFYHSVKLTVGILKIMPGLEISAARVGLLAMCIISKVYDEDKKPPVNIQR